MAWFGSRSGERLAERREAFAGERYALTTERIAILEAQRRSDKEEFKGHADSCTEKWSETRDELKGLRRHVDERFDMVEAKRGRQHAVNVGLLSSILAAIIAGFTTAAFEHWIK